jgi:hypothetical protein
MYGIGAGAEIQCTVLALGPKLAIFEILKIMSVDKFEHLVQYCVTMSHGLNLLLC